MAIGSVNPVQIIAEKLQPIWAAASEKVYSAISDPLGALKAMGDFAIDAAQDSWNVLRGKYKKAHMHINFITDILDTPCEDKWSVIVDTALPAAGDAMYLLIVPSFAEVVEEYLQPRSSRSKRKGPKDTGGVRRAASRAGRIRRYFPRFPDVDGLIANNLPGREMVKGRDVGAGQKWLFAGIDIADRIGWYWLLLDVGETFIYHWSSNLMQARFCERPWSGVLHINRTQFNVTDPRRAWDKVTDVNIITQRNIDILSNGRIEIPAEFEGCTMIFTGTGTPTWGGSSTERFTWRIVQSPGTVLARQDVFSEDNDPVAWALNVEVDGIAGQEFYFEHFATRSPIDWTVYEWELLVLIP